MEEENDIDNDNDNEEEDDIDEDDDQDDFNDNYGSLNDFDDENSSPDLTKMTERQRQKYFEEQVDPKKTKFLSLSNEIHKKKVLTEEEQQMKRAETARRRKNQNEKRLEEEKQDTLNKLLKKRASKARDLKSLDENNKIETSVKDRRPIITHKALFRWISTKDEFSLTAPEGLGF
ncbi:PAPA-1-like domain-containing protein ASCRUDRAFT_30441 [Ascoidea rubescens DSM 1968]|uniref:INO80 complex subunit B-like conserved region domain-containing protein n=1 Tax=Ascoidea rubescens DSM 1968 TaxID=1344418 RepID=A0A1D2VS47_9ASCO|nr:hypothetical protein ASCRUDRAFT_30441 [Ascoidea rubescens DSM 1968]ODV64434.1 hypothetical protein ASCRUDRAFT_30441 [Ascoidea rubescens DSM 1968]